MLNKNSSEFLKKRYQKRFSSFKNLQEKIDSLDDFKHFLPLDEINISLDNKYILFARIKSIKKHSSIVFFLLGNKLTQACIKADSVLFEDGQKLVIGDIIWFDAQCILSDNNVLTLNIINIFRLSLNCHNLQNIHFSKKQNILQEKNYTLSRINDLKEMEILHKRSFILNTLRLFLFEKKFIEVNTPILQLIASGADAQPFVTYSNREKKEKYLRIASECFLKRLIISGFNKIFEIGPCFRNESYSPHHFSEFIMLEGYIVNYRFLDIANFVVDMFNFIITELNKEYQEKNDILKPTIISVEELFYQKADILELNKSILSDFCFKNDLTPSDDVGEVMVDYVEKYALPDGLVILTKLPLSKTALARPIDDSFSESCDIYLDGVEISTIFTENTNPIIQDEILKLYSNNYDEEFIQDMYLGMPCLGGFGVGIDRLTKYLLKKKHLRDVYSFIQ